MQGIYVDEETGKPISTQSMLKTFRRCPKQADYKYVQRLKPKSVGRPLREGTWMHSLVETRLRGGEWRDKHAELTKKFSQLFDEEREALGNLPNRCAQMMRSYIWHYSRCPWKTIDVEFMLEAELPNGHIYRVKIDWLIEDQYGLWLVDHKWNKSLPDNDMRILDVQSVPYVWAARKNKIPVQGFIWDYCKRKPASIPKVTKAGRLSRAACETDYPTLYRRLKELDMLDDPALRPWLRRLLGERFEHGMVQTSPFFRRNVMERTPGMLRTLMREQLHTSKRMHEYPFELRDAVERVPDRSCGFMCSYDDLCTLEAFGGDTHMLRRQKYETVDPLYYYNDDPKDVTTRGEN